MDKIDIRDLILRTLKANEIEIESSTGFEFNTVISEDYLKIAETIVENLPIYVVMQQRELLINYNNYLYAEYHGADYDNSDIDVFLEQMGN